MSTPLVVIAIGGNSLIRDAKHMTVPDQYQAAGDTSHHIAGIVKMGYRVLITHGNGPQVGFILLRSELARNFLHSVPLEVCVADTQGAIGYQIAQTLGNELRQLGMERPIVPVVTQVVVDANDPAFQNPSKPIGPFMTEAEAKGHELEVGWQTRLCAEALAEAYPPPVRCAQRKQGGWACREAAARHPEPTSIQCADRRVVNPPVCRSLGGGVSSTSKVRTA